MPAAGTCVVPPGRFLTGPIRLRSHVDLHVTEDATIAFSQDPDDYLPAVFTRWEGTELYNYSPLIYAFGQRNIAVTGAGTLDGQADNAHWWPWKGNPEFGWRPGDPHQADARPRCRPWPRTACRSSSGSSAPAGTCGRTSSQPYRCTDVLDRRRHDRQLPHVGDPPGPVAERAGRAT